MKRKPLAISIIVFNVLLAIVAIKTNNNISVASTIELGQSLGFITLIPTVLSVILAFVTQNVLFSLLIGFLSGVFILGIVNSANVLHIPSNLFVYLFENIKEVVFNVDNIEILLLCFAVGGMIEVVKSSGSLETLAIRLTKKVNSPKKANLVASLLGCLVFFDDYANTLIVGPIMKPITDRVKVSREKLAFIVDSTSAPVSGIALISSWIAAETVSIEKGLEIVGDKTNGFSLFLSSIPYCFYCIFAITFIFVNGLLDRDFGPMLKAERKARQNITISNDDKTSEQYEEKKKANSRVFVGVGSISLLTIIAIMMFYFNGKTRAVEIGALSATTNFTFKSFITAISHSDTVALITIAALLSTLFTIIFGSLLKLFTIKESLLSWFKGVKNISDEVLMLLVAWCLANTVKLMGTTYFVSEIISSIVAPMFIPVLIFIACCLISCASGSFGCMFVVMPLAIPLAYNVINMGIGINEQMYLSMCVGSVVAGSIFGDHCSPITDCTILAASSCDCSTMDHCYSQLPYTIVNMIICVLCGIILTYLGLNAFISITIGVLAQILILFIIGKKPI